MVKTLITYIKQNKRVYFWGSFFAILMGLISLIPNYIIQLFIDNIIYETLTTDQLLIYLLGFAVCMVTIYFTDMAWVRLLFGQSARFQKELRQKIFQRMLILRTPFYEKFRSGDLLTRMTSDIDMMGTALGYGFMILVADGTYLISVIAIMVLAISWQVTLISIIPLIIFGVIVYFIGVEVDRRYEVSRDAVAQLSNEVLEVVDGIRVIRAYGRKKLQQDRFAKRTSEVVATSNRLILLNALFGPVARLFSGLSNALGLLYGGFLVAQGSMSVGQLITFQIYLGMLNGVVWGMSDLVAIYQQANVSYRKIHELEIADDLVEENGDQPIDAIEKIEFKDYHFTYPGDNDATIKDINLTLHRGETLGIVGKTGAGKSTLVRQLLRQYPLDNPESLLINGQPISDYRIEDIEKLMGYVPQEHILFSRTVAHNIYFGNSEATEEDLSHAIEIAHFDKDIHRMSQGLDTLIGEKGVAISGGQKQRVSIARAFIKEPELLILDDSLSAVDAKTERAIIGNIQAIRKDKTNIIVSHRLSAVAEADKIIVLDKGRIIESGTSNQLLDLGGWYYDQFQRQQIGDEQDASI